MLPLYFKLGNRSEYQFTLRVVEKKKTVYFKIIFASYSSIIILMSLYRQESYFSWKSVIVHVHMYIFVSMDFFTKIQKPKQNETQLKKNLSGKIFLTFYRVLCHAVGSEIIPWV